MKNFLRGSLTAILVLSLSLGNVWASVDPVAITLPTATSGDPVANNPGIQEAFKDFKSLTKAERKSRIKEAKSTLKQYKKDKKAGVAAAPSQIVLIILAILLPPLAVYLHQGEINNKFWISLLLTLLFFLPGIIYALLVITGEV